MASNIYRVNKKFNLDKIIGENLLKPVCCIFTQGLKDKENEFNKTLVDTLLTISKVNTYCVIVVVDFDDFTDDTGHYDKAKGNVPFFIIYFKKKGLYYYDTQNDTQNNFIAITCEYISKFNETYKNIISDKIIPEDFYPKEQQNQQIEIQNDEEEDIENEEKVDKQQIKTIKNKSNNKNKKNKKEKIKIEQSEEDYEESEEIEQSENEEDESEESEEEIEQSEEELDSVQLREREEKRKKLETLRKLSAKQKNR